MGDIVREHRAKGRQRQSMMYGIRADNRLSLDLHDVRLHSQFRGQGTEALTSGLGNIIMTFWPRKVPQTNLEVNLNLVGC